MASSSSTMELGLPSSSSSFGDAENLFFFINNVGDLYSFWADEHWSDSNLIFKSFSNISSPPVGLAISKYILTDESSSSEILTSSSSSLSSGTSISNSSVSGSEDSSSSSTSMSTSSPSSSISSQSTVNYLYNIYILRKKNSTTANLDIRDIDGYQKGSIDFSSGFNFLGLAIYPNQNNLLVSISQYYFHLIYISSGQIGLYSIESPVELSYGICAKNIVDETKAQFFVKSKNTKEIVLVEISKRDKTCTIINSYASSLSKWQRLGGIACELGTYGLIGEMSTIFQIVEEEKGLSKLSKMVILTGSPTTTHLFNMPFTVYSMSIPVLVTSSPSLIESVKAPVLNFRQYDSNGIFVANFQSLFMGNFQPGVKSDVTIVNLLVEGVSSISNVKLGIIENGIIGSQINNTVMYGISDIIDPSFIPTHYFAGVNENNTADNINNINVGIKSTGEPIESKYIYLKIDMPEKYMGRAYLTFRFFFDYED